jgi:RES domain-containing protein
VIISAWRIFKSREARDAFTGEGARRFGGRWNSRGTPIVYTAESVALAILEILVQLESRKPLPAYRIAMVKFDASLVSVLRQGQLPRNWRAEPPPARARLIGDNWILRARSAVLRVPSAVVPRANNFLLNPGHPDFARISLGKPERFEFDARLIS